MYNHCDSTRCSLYNSMVDSVKEREEVQGLEELSVLRSMMDYDLYNKYSPVLFGLEGKEPEYTELLNTIKEYYSKYREHKSISIDELRLFHEYLNPVAKDRSTINTLLDKIASIEISNIVLLTDNLNKVAEEHALNLIGQTCFAKKEGIAAVELLIVKHKSLVAKIQDSESEVCNLTLPELLLRDKATGLSWRMQFLQRTIGPLKPGTLGHIFARPETGKTSLGLSEATFFVRQLMGTPDVVLYLSNEEPIERLKLRAHTAMLASPVAVLNDRAMEGKEYWEAHNGNALKMIGDVTQLEQVEKHIHTFTPKVVFIDQGAKVSLPGFPGGENEPRKLQQLYQRYRELAKTYNTVIITLGQADINAEHKRWLTLGNLDSSKVGIPGELDFAIGIGMTIEEGMGQVRFINVCKNKIRGLLDKTEVQFDKMICQYN